MKSAAKAAPDIIDAYVLRDARTRELLLIAPTFQSLELAAACADRPVRGYLRETDLSTGETIGEWCVSL